MTWDQTSTGSGLEENLPCSRRQCSKSSLRVRKTLDIWTIRLQIHTDVSSHKTKYWPGTMCKMYKYVWDQHQDWPLPRGWWLSITIAALLDSCVTSCLMYPRSIHISQIRTIVKACSLLVGFTTSFTYSWLFTTTRAAKLTNITTSHWSWAVICV